MVVLKVLIDGYFDRIITYFKWKKRAFVLRVFNTKRKSKGDDLIHVSEY